MNIKTESITDMPFYELAKSLAIPNAQPELYAFLNNLVNVADPAMQEMEDNLDKLKVAFMESVYEICEQEKIDIHKRIIMGFDATGNLILLDSHPQAEQINDILANTQKLCYALKQIAVDSYLLQSIQGIGKILNNEIKDGSKVLVQNYQVCFKGELSHFYYA